MVDIAKEAIWFGYGPNMRHHGRERLHDRVTSKRSPTRTLTVLERDEALDVLTSVGCRIRSISGLDVALL
jgi:hypothetical protein